MGHLPELGATGQAEHFGVLQALAVHLARAEAAEPQCRGHRIREAVLRLFSVAWLSRIQRDGLEKARDLDSIDLLSIDPILSTEGQRGFDGRLCPPADRVRFEVLLEDAPSAPQIGEQFLDVCVLLGRIA